MPDNPPKTSVSTSSSRSKSRDVDRSEGRRSPSSLTGRRSSSAPEVPSTARRPSLVSDASRDSGSGDVTYGPRSPESVRSRQSRDFVPISSTDVSLSSVSVTASGTALLVSSAPVSVGMARTSLIQSAPSAQSTPGPLGAPWGSAMTYPPFWYGASPVPPPPGFSMPFLPVPPLYTRQPPSATVSRPPDVPVASSLSGGMSSLPRRRSSAQVLDARSALHRGAFSSGRPHPFVGSRSGQVSDPPVSHLLMSDSSASPDSVRGFPEDQSSHSGDDVVDQREGDVDSDDDAGMDDPPVLLPESSDPLASSLLDAISAYTPAVLAMEEDHADLTLTDQALGQARTRTSRPVVRESPLVRRSLKRARQRFLVPSVEGVLCRRPFPKDQMMPQFPEVSES